MSDLIVNGGFESGQAPWQEQSAGNYQLISQSVPHTGSFSADFCNTTSCNDQLWQTITVPAQVDTATLTFWLSVAGQPTAACNDSFSIALRTTTGALIDLVSTVCAGSAASGWVQESASVTPFLQQYAGQQIQVYFQGMTHASDSSFYLDDVSLMVQAPVSPTAVAAASETASAAETSTATGGTIVPTVTVTPTVTAVPTPSPRPTLTPTPIPDTRATELIVNGGFESGQAPWQEQSAGDYQLIGQDKAHSGTSSAEFCGANVPCNDQLWQTVTLPTQFDTLNLSFWLWSATQDPSACVDTFVAMIRTTSGSPITTVATKCNAGATNSWQQVSADLAATLQPYAGEQIQVYFQAVTTGGNLTGFYLDDVSLVAQVPIPTVTPTSTATATPTSTLTPTVTPTPSVQIVGMQLLRRPRGAITDTCDAVLASSTPLAATRLLYPNQTGILRVLYRPVNPGSSPAVGQVVYEENAKPVDGDVLLPAGNAQQPTLCSTISFSGSGVHHFTARVTVTLGRAVSTASIGFYVGKCGNGVTGANGQCVRCNKGYRLSKGKCQRISHQAVRPPSKPRPRPSATPRAPSGPGKGGGKLRHLPQ